MAATAAAASAALSAGAQSNSARPDALPALSIAATSYKAHAAQNATSRLIDHGGAKMTKASSGGSTTAAVRILVRNTQRRARGGLHRTEAPLAALIGVQR